MIASSLLDLQHLEGLVFDMDGTLYAQTRVRLSILWRLMRAHGRRPVEGWSTLMALRAYRGAQERLRSSAPGCRDLADEQLAFASWQTGMPVRRLREHVERWMEHEPLAVVAQSRRRGIVDVLQAARNRGLKLGVFSDYPAVAKLRALELETFFDVIVSAQDPDVRRFKPDPRGLEVTLYRLGVDPSRAIYVGDRPSVDGAAARRAGMPCLIVGGRCRSDAWMQPTTCADLARRLLQAA